MRKSDSDIVDRYYPSDPGLLRTWVEQFLNAAPHSSIIETPCGALVPHPSYLAAGHVLAAGMAPFKNLADTQPIVYILALKHDDPFKDIALCSLEHLNTPLGVVQIHTSAYQQLMSHDSFYQLMTKAFQDEHSVMTLLPYIQVLFPHSKIVPLLIGDIDPFIVAKRLLKVIKAGDVIFASGDLSHGLSEEQAKEVDMLFLGRLLRGDMDVYHDLPSALPIQEVRPIVTLFLLAHVFGWHSSLVKYDTSAFLSGEEQVVGYGSILFTK
jgi:AmmeMemoRadiSam system protein B